MALRKIRYFGPDSEWLDASQFASYLCIDVEIFMGLVKQGVIPPPRQKLRCEEEDDWEENIWPWEAAAWTSTGIAYGWLKLPEEE